MGQLKSIDKLDVKFFGLMDKIGHNIDPQSRIMLETTYEAIVDGVFTGDNKFHYLIDKTVLIQE